MLVLCVIATSLREPSSWMPSGRSTATYIAVVTRRRTNGHVIPASRSHTAKYVAVNCDIRSPIMMCNIVADAAFSTCL